MEPRSSLATGIDLVEVERIRDAVSRHGAAFLERIFTPSERTFCEGRPDPAPHFAARFAAKEAAFKMLGTGWAQGVGWHDAEVARSEAGAPSLLLHGQAAEIAARLGLRRFALSLTHTAAYAAAVVVGEG